MSTLRNASSSNFTAPSRISGAMYLLVPTWERERERERERVIGRVVMATLIAHAVKATHDIQRILHLFQKIKKIAGHKLAIMHDWSTAWTVFTHIQSNIITVLLLILLIIYYYNQIPFYYSHVLSKISLYMYKDIRLHKCEDNNHIAILGTNEQSSIHSHTHHTLLQLYNWMKPVIQILLKVLIKSYARVNSQNWN